MRTGINNGPSPTGMNRVDGRLKVTGAAKYAAEYAVPHLVYGVLVGSTITKGNVKSIDAKQAERAPGVLKVVSHLNSPQVKGYQHEPGKPVPTKGPMKVFYDNKILFNGQPVALVIADTFERALFAASLVKVEYNAEPHITSLKDNAVKSFKSPDDGEYQRGTPDAWKTAPVKLEQEYLIPTEVHNPMELHSIIAK